MTTYLYNKNCEETAYVVEDYPWGFRLRTKIRYWVESKPGYGQRSCRQIMNPKTGKWCAPKKGVYHELVFMYCCEKGYPNFDCYNLHTCTEILNECVKLHGDNLTDYQVHQIKKGIARNKVMENVTFTISEVSNYGIGPVSLFSNDAEEIRKRKLLLEKCEEREQKNKQVLNKIEYAIACEYSKINI